MIILGDVFLFYPSKASIYWWEDKALSRKELRNALQNKFPGVDEVILTNSTSIHSNCDEFHVVGLTWYEDILEEIDE